MTFHPKTQQVISGFVGVSTYSCTISPWASSGENIPHMDVAVVLPSDSLNPGTIEIFVLDAHRQRFEQHIRSALYYDGDFESNCLSFEEPDDTLGGASVCWYTFLGMYGVKDFSKLRLGIGFRLGQLIARLESFGLSEHLEDVATTLYEAYAEVVAQDVRLRWSKQR